MFRVWKWEYSMFELCWIIFVEWCNLYFKGPMFIEWLSWKWNLLWFSFLLFFLKNYSILKWSEWIGCHSNCSTCTGPSLDNCLSCPQSKLLLEGTCVDQCPLKYYLVNTTRACESKESKKNSQKRSNNKIKMK